MNPLYGNARIIFHDIRVYLGKILFLYITIPLLAAWIIIGIVFTLPDDVFTQISIPVYVNIAVFSLIAFKPLLPVAVGMGSTRLQFLKAFYGISLGAVFLIMLLLNFCQFILASVYNHMHGWSNVLHPAVFFRSDYDFIPYFWIDLMVGLFVFGVSFLIYCLWHSLGTSRCLLILTAAVITGLFLYFGGVLETWLTWVWRLDLDALVLFTIPGTIGLVALFSTYPMMRHVPLYPRPRQN